MTAIPVHRRTTLTILVVLLCVTAPPSLAEDLTRDPVCGMRPRADGSVTATFAGETYSFWCDGCRKLFVEDPQQYLDLQTVSPDGRPVMAGVPIRPVLWSGACLLLGSFLVFEILDRRGCCFARPRTGD